MAHSVAGGCPRCFFLLFDSPLLLSAALPSPSPSPSPTSSKRTTTAPPARRCTTFAMRNLATADVAFLLLSTTPTTTAKTGQAAACRLTLETDYGLVIRREPEGTIAAALATVPTSCPSSNARQKPAPVSSSIDEILYLASGTTNPLHLYFGTSPSPNHSTTPATAVVGYRCRIRPGPGHGHDDGVPSVWYAPGWPGNPHTAASSSRVAGSDKRARIEELAARYPAAWIGAYLDWADRFAEAAEAAGQASERRRRKRQSRRTTPFADEGERALWLAEGLLLACWLSLQSDVGAVEYDPEDWNSRTRGREACLLQKGDAGVAVARFLDDLRSSLKSSVA